ncbi:MAG: hypothetical protein WDN31_17175 [Hyphomicrobium sp.]
MAPVWVILFSGLVIGEKVMRREVYGLGLCIAGAASLIGTSYSARPDHLAGDLYAVATSFFFGLYSSPCASRVGTRAPAASSSSPRCSPPSCSSSSPSPSRIASSRRASAALAPSPASR